MTGGRLKTVAVAVLLYAAPPISAQHTEVSFDLTNETGSYRLLSRTFSHEQDNREGFSCVVDRSETDTLYHLDEFLNGWVALSNDGRTIAHLETEKDGKPMDAVSLTFYRDGKHFDTAKLFRFLGQELKEAERLDRLPKSGWLRNDSLLHKMASNPFYITDDKLFISMEGPRLMVFDMNAMFHIYTGNGANHFLQNYYSIPSAPRRKEHTSEAYFPKGFPQTDNGRELETVVASILNSKISIPEEAKFRVEMSIKLNENRGVEIRNIAVFSTKTNEELQQESENLKRGLSDLKLETSLLPPGHPAWIFSGNIWLK